MQITSTETEVVSDKPKPPKPAKTATKDKPAQPRKENTLQKQKDQSNTGSEKWIVQIGSFSRQTNAQALTDKLKSSGYAAYVATAQAKSGPVFRVRIGPVKNRVAADKIVSKLAKQGGYRAIVIAND